MTWTDPDLAFIVGSGRNGSTLLGRLLGQLTDVVYVGETDLLWGTGTDQREPPWGLPRGRQCGCGRSIAECPVWSAALSGMAAELDLAQEGELAPTMLWLSNRRSFVRPIAHQVRRRTRVLGYASGMATLYRQIAKASDARLVVDSSKRRSTAHLIGDLVETFQASVRVIHIVREPAATVHSWNTHLYLDSVGVPQMARFGLFNASLRWIASNVQAELVVRRVGQRNAFRVRYEDLIHSPDYSFAAIVGRLGLPGARLPIEGRKISVQPCHTVAGHPTRFDVGDIVIEGPRPVADEPTRTQRTIPTLLTYPVARRYGYRKYRHSAVSRPEVEQSSRHGPNLTTLKVLLVGGIYGLSEADRSQRSMTPETVLENGLRERGITVVTAGHDWTASRGDADIVHVHHLGKGAVAQLLPNRHRPVVFTRHDVGSLKSSRRLALSAVLHQSSAVIALSPAEKARLCERLPAHRVHLIPNGVRSDLWPFQQRISPQRTEPWSLLYVGQLIDLKNVSILIEAVAKLRTELPITLRLAYHNPTREHQLRGLARDFGVERQVLFLGHCDHRQLQKEYERAHLFVLPSAHEAFPTVVTEAMMSGVPVIATAVGGIPDQLAGHGRLVAPGDSGALACAISDTIAAYDDVLDLAELAEAFARRHYSVTSMIDAHLNLYVDLARS